MFLGDATFTIPLPWRPGAPLRRFYHEALKVGHPKTTMEHRRRCIGSFMDMVTMAGGHLKPLSGRRSWKLTT
jgi:hypothetical protein